MSCNKTKTKYCIAIPNSALKVSATGNPYFVANVLPMDFAKENKQKSLSQMRYQFYLYLKWDTNFYLSSSCVHMCDGNRHDRQIDRQAGRPAGRQADKLTDWYLISMNNQPWRSYQGEIIFIKSEGKVWLPFYGMHSYIYLERLGKKWSWMNWEGRHLKHSISISMSEKFKALDSQQIKFLHPWYPDTRKCTMYARISDYSSCSRFQ